MKEVHEITSVEQAKVFSHELRIEIMKCFLYEKPKTAKQIADELEMAASKVHYHVKELVKVGLLELVETRENSGIIEKYYLPVAKLFRINLNKEELSDEDLIDPKITMLMSAASEVKQSIRLFPDAKQKFLNFYIDLTDEEREEFMNDVDQVFKRWDKKVEGRDRSDTTIYGLVMGLYPHKKGGES